MIRVGIFGYGNLGKGVERAVTEARDMTLVAIFTRRDPASVRSESGTAVYAAAAVSGFLDEIDVLVLTVGSANDLPLLSPRLAANFNTVDAYDAHAAIPQYFRAVDEAAKRGGKTAVVAVGWDPGLFSLFRLLGEAFFSGTGCTFWGKGVSQGHSEALRKIPGVRDAVQYTLPKKRALFAAKSGKFPTGGARAYHKRLCLIAPEAGADKKAIAKTVREMPHYFAGYSVKIRFVSEEKLRKKRKKLPHGGEIFFRDGGAAMNMKMVLSSNPEFTGKVAAAYARAVYRLHEAGETGAKTALDIPLKYLAENCEPEGLFPLI